MLRSITTVTNPKPTDWSNVNQIRNAQNSRILTFESIETFIQNGEVKVSKGDETMLTYTDLQNAKNLIEKEIKRYKNSPETSFKVLLGYGFFRILINYYTQINGIFYVFSGYLTVYVSDPNELNTLVNSLNLPTEETLKYSNPPLNPSIQFPSNTNQTLPSYLQNKPQIITANTPSSVIYKSSQLNYTPIPIQQNSQIQNNEQSYLQPNYLQPNYLQPNYLQPNYLQQNNTPIINYPINTANLNTRPITQITTLETSINPNL